MSVLLSSTLVLAAAAHDTTAQKPGSWIKSGGHYYWKLTAGSNLTNAFLDYDGETYYLASDGIMAKGWAKADGHWYYFHTWGMYKNIFFDYDGSTYYVDSSGIMATGWKKLNGYWYYFHDWGGMYKNTFFNYDGETYYVDAEGKMATGWAQIDGIWHYFHDWGGMYKSTFFDYDGETYYVDASGEMAAGWNTINGAVYCFQSWGGAYRGWNELTRSNYLSGKKYWNYFNNSGKLITDSDIKGCSHGKSTFSDFHITTDLPIKYYSLVDSGQNSLIDTSATRWGTTYFTKTQNLTEAKLLFEYSDVMSSAIIAETNYYINNNLKTVPTANYQSCRVYINKNKSPASSATISHEMGHVLGLSHRISFSTSIMCYADNRTVSIPQSTDFDCANHIN